VLARTSIDLVYGGIYSRGWPDITPTRPEKEPATRSLERYWEREYDKVEAPGDSW